MASQLDLNKVSRTIQIGLPLGAIVLGLNENYVGAAILGSLSAVDTALRYAQSSHAILKNYGLFGGARYILESFGPEFRQYLSANDTEERPFDRRTRTLVYKLAKDEKTKSVAFGTLEDLAGSKAIRHSLFTDSSKEIEPFSLTFGDARDLENSYTINHPVMISGMSYGALGDRAVRALSKGAKLAGVPMNTGEGGLSEYHLSGGSDIIFQIGTGKYGVANPDGTLNDDKLRGIVSNDRIKMVEIKFSQGAKPGAGAFLPKEKITPGLAKTRGVSMNEDLRSPSRHKECTDYISTVNFIKRVQDVSQLPTGIKMCYGREDEFNFLLDEMKNQNVFPDYIVIDGAEGGTGAASQDFVDHVGVPLAPALRKVISSLEERKIRDKTKVIVSGKLVTPGNQIMALAGGADAIYTGRGALLALGCIQALECNTGKCPVGITTHDPHLQKGLDVDLKAERISNYFGNLKKGLDKLLGATGHSSYGDLTEADLYDPTNGD